MGGLGSTNGILAWVGQTSPASPSFVLQCLTFGPPPHPQGHDLQRPIRMHLRGPSLGLEGRCHGDSHLQSLGFIFSPSYIFSTPSRGAPPRWVPPPDPISFSLEGHPKANPTRAFYMPDRAENLPMLGE